MKKNRLTREIVLHITSDMENFQLSKRTDGGAKFAGTYDKNNLKAEILKCERQYDELENCHFICKERAYTGNGRRKISLSARDKI